MVISNVYADNGDLTIAKKPGVSTVHIDNMPQGGGSSGVTSVNGQTGDVTLSASDVGALPSSTIIPTVDQTYDATSTNAQSGTAVAGAIANINNVPTVGDTDDGKVLKATYSGGVGSYSWESAGGAQNVIFLTYNNSYTAQELLEIYNNARSNTILYCLVRYGIVYTLTTAYSGNNNTSFYFTFVSYRNYVSINPTYNNYASGTLDYIHMNYNGNSLSWTAKSSDVALITPHAICGSSEIPANRLPAGTYTQGTVKFLQTVGSDSCEVYLWRCKNTTTYTKTFDPLYDSANWERVSIEQLLSGN